ncbi:MAG: hypothetical protein QM758_11520 [Armatimonas sp.]
MPSNFFNLEEPYKYLEQVDPELVKRLKEQGPRPDGGLATANERVVGGPAKEKHAATVWEEALTNVLAEAETKATDIRLQLKNANRLQLGIDICSAVAASTLIALIAGDKSKTTLIITAAITLVGVILGAVVKYLRVALISGAKADAYVALNKLIGEGTLLVLQIQAWGNTDPPRPPFDPALEARIVAFIPKIKEALGLAA